MPSSIPSTKEFSMKFGDTETDLSMCPLDSGHSSLKTAVKGFPSQKIHRTLSLSSAAQVNCTCDFISGHHQGDRHHGFPSAFSPVMYSNNIHSLLHIHRYTIKHLNYEINYCTAYILHIHYIGLLKFSQYIWISNAALSKSSLRHQAIN